MRTRINRLIIFFILIVIYITVCTGCGQVPSSAAQNQTSAQNVSQAPSSFLEQTTELSNGVCIAEVFSYTGPYVEDGSNDPCEGICAVRLYNPTSIHYQYLRFSVETSGGRAVFTATTLFSGAEMIVLAEERAPFSDSAVLSVKLLTEVPFETAPSVHLDTLSISFSDGYINVKNLTDDMVSDVFVYYKQTEDGRYLGGITYRTRFGEIPAGETVQMNARNIRKDGSIVVYATYVS